MYITNHPASSAKPEKPADRPVCGEIMIAGEWLAVCVLPPDHDPCATHLPSPYVGR